MQFGVNRSAASFLNPLFLIFVVFFSALFLVSFSKHAFSLCNHKEGTGAVFYNFDELIVYYVDFPRPGLIPPDSEVLQFDKFNARLLTALKESFGTCLKTSLGVEKPISVIPPLYMRSGERGLSLNPERIHDSKNLTIVMRVSYVGYPPRPSGVEDFGQASFFLYRPEVSHKQARIPVPFNSGMITFFPRKGDTELTRWFDGFFRSIRPTGGSSAPPGVLIRPE